jgi:plasmid stabilization system protein ParE
MGDKSRIREAEARATVMELKWTSKALSDLVRLHEFLAHADDAAAARTVQSLVAAPVRLRNFPRIGEKLDEFAPREVRRILVGRYEIRYEIGDEVIHVLRIWHTREER